MRGWIKDSLHFLFWLGLLQLARLIAVLFCALEMFAVLGLWGLAIAKYSASLHAAWLWIPVAATSLLMVQIALWQYWWLRIAQRSDHWRAIAECFCSAVRHPVVRNPHPWE